MFDAFDFFWNRAQDRRIDQLDREIRHGALERGATPDLEARVDRLQLICAAMWSLLKEQHGLTEEQLAERIRRIDLLDGREDGKVSPLSARCEKCGRSVSRRNNRCIYCGHQPPVPFDPSPG